MKRFKFLLIVIIAFAIGTSVGYILFQDEVKDVVYAKVHIDKVYRSYYAEYKGKPVILNNDNLYPHGIRKRMHTILEGDTVTLFVTNHHKEKVGYCIGSVTKEIAEEHVNSINGILSILTGFIFIFFTIFTVGYVKYSK